MVRPLATHCGPMICRSRNPPLRLRRVQFMVASVMIGLVIAITVASSAQVSCLKADSADVVVDRQTLDVKGGKSLEAVSVSHRGNGPEGFSSSSVIVYSANCDVVFQQRY